MRNPSDDELIQRLVSILAAGFNRSIGELEEAGAIDTRKLRKDYMPGSKYYDLVSEQLIYTATCGSRGIRELFEGPDSKLAFDFDHAMCVYLGGDTDSAGIQIGLGAERLEREYGPATAQIKSRLDAFLAAASARTLKGEDSDGIADRLARETPSLSSVCRRKIAARVMFDITH